MIRRVAVVVAVFTLVAHGEAPWVRHTIDDDGREEVVLAFASGTSLYAFAREHGIDRRQLEQLLRTGLVRAVDDAERALSPYVVIAVRQRLVRRRPNLRIRQLTHEISPPGL